MGNKKIVKFENGRTLRYEVFDDNGTPLLIFFQKTYQGFI